MEWLDIEEELPTYQKKIIITNGKWVDVVDEHGVDGDNEYYFHDRTGKLDGITHWMPLPEKPE